MSRTISLGAVIAFAIQTACSTSSTSASGDDAGNDGSALNDAGVNDGSAGDADAGARTPDCFRADDVCNTSEPSAPRARQGVCTSDQIDSVYINCFVGDDAGPDGGDLCDAFMAANPACASCFLGPGGPSDGGTEGPAAVLTYSEMTGELVVDVAGCVAAISGGDAACKLAYDLRSVCGTAACAHCPPGPETQTCIAWATTDPGSPLVAEYIVDAACQAAIQAVSISDQQTKCGVDVTDAQAQFAIVATTMCGP